MDYNAANEKFQDMITKVKQHENQMNILMDLMKIPKDERNFVELKNKIEKIIAEKKHLTIYTSNQIQQKC